LGSLTFPRMDLSNCTFTDYKPDLQGFPSLSSYPAYNTFEAGSPQLSGSPYLDSDSLSDKSKKIRKRRSTYKKIDDKSRADLLNAVQEGETLKAAAKRYGINYSSAKSILHTFRKEGRIFKKSAQERNTRKRSKASPELTMSPIYPYKQCQEEYGNMPMEPHFKTCFPLGSNFKYGSPSKYASTDEGSPNTGQEALKINCFGGFLKVDSQGRQSSESLSIKSPASTYVFKLESQKNPSVPSDGTQGLQGKNWQLNFNVRSGERLEGHQQGNHHFPQNNQQQQRQENEQFNRMGYSNVPQILNKPRKEPMNYSSFNHSGNVSYPTTDEQSYDVSCFLDPSPAYAFQEGSDVRQYGVPDNFSSFNFGAPAPEAQDVFYDEKKAPHVNNFSQKVGEENIRLMKNAPPRSF